MPNYRCNRVPGGTFFFTVNPLDRRSDLLVTEVDRLCAAVRQVRALAPFHIDGWVVLPDHMHCLWTLPQGDADPPGRWRAIKLVFVKSLPSAEPRSAVMTRRGERGIWQRRYWEHTIGTITTSPCISTIFTSIRSNTVSSVTRQIGAFDVSPVPSRRAVCRRMDRQPGRTAAHRRAPMKQGWRPRGICRR
jgi:REP element-mobilizing transposase RayT